MFKLHITKLLNNNRRASSPIGCQFLQDRLNMGQLDFVNDNNLNMRKTVCPLDLKRGADEAGLQGEADKIVRCMRSAGFVGKDVVVSLPIGDVTYQKFSIAPMPGDELKAAIQWQAARELKQTRESLCTEYCTIQNAESYAGKCQDVLAYIVDRQTIDLYINVLLSAGLYPVAVDLVPAAYARCLALQEDVGEGATRTVLIVVGADQSTLYLLDRGLPIFVRQFQFCWNMLEKRFQSVGCTPGAEAFRHPRLDQVNSGDENDHLDDCAGVSHEMRHQICRAAVKDLAHDIRLCVRYLNDVGMIYTIPERAVVLSSADYGQDILESINEASGIRFVGARSVLPHAISHGGALCDLDDDWIAVAGLCLYSRPVTYLKVS